LKEYFALHFLDTFFRLIKIAASKFVEYPTLVKTTMKIDEFKSLETKQTKRDYGKSLKTLKIDKV